MYVKSALIIFTLILYTCTSFKQDRIITRIKSLEYSRNDSSGIFDRFIDNGTDEVKISIIDAIAKIQNPVHLPCLQKLLVIPDPRYIDKLLFALGQIHAAQSVNILTALYVQDKYKPYLRKIIRALGKTEVKSAGNFIAANMVQLPDTLLDEAIASLAFLIPRDSVPADVKRQMIDFLAHPAENVMTAAAYFFTRHPDSAAVENLIRCRLAQSGLGYKYRLRALQRTFEKYGVSGFDSLALGALISELLSNQTFNNLPWSSNLYRLSLLAYYPDSLSATILSGYLKAAIPHLRTAAIRALSRMKTRQAAEILMSNFDQATWSDKGETISGLAGEYPQMVNLLIQNNLDKGTLYFKQLLLAALAQIGNPAAVQQLRQFLLVPDKRLVYAAYNGLVQCNQLQPGDVKAALLSGDLALVATAAEAIPVHPQWCPFQDLEKAYSKLSEPYDVEAMISLLPAAVTVDSQRAIPFLRRVAEKASSPLLTDQAIELLRKSGGKNLPPERREKLYIAGGYETGYQPVDIVIHTEKGNIEVELWPNLAPATVANFISLIQKKFYNNLTFHRVVSDFVIQGGDPRGDGWGGPGYNIPCEYNEAEFKRGTIGMATAGKDTGGSQFFICQSDQPHLNGKYTAFGCVQKGEKVVDIIEIGDKILEITIKQRGAL
jgi:cyclophilin family peptidyl-prolyl cis-trans isomerase/HEAT repeat protein